MLQRLVPKVNKKSNGKKYGDHGCYFCFQKENNNLDKRNKAVKHVEAKCDRNFVLENIFENINSVAQKSDSFRVDTRHGARQLLNNSGLQQHFTAKQGYGQLPLYLLKRNKENEIEQENYTSYIASQEYSLKSEQISNNERLEILEGLKNNWNLLNQQYLSISLTLDTYQKQMRKKILEIRMKQLEKDMEIFETNDIAVVNV